MTAQIEAITITNKDGENLIVQVAKPGVILSIGNEEWWLDDPAFLVEWLEKLTKTG